VASISVRALNVEEITRYVDSIHGTCLLELSRSR
jgi:hypothetical protein